MKSLCFRCRKFRPGTAHQCDASMAVYSVRQEHDILCAVVSCPNFDAAGDEVDGVAVEVMPGLWVSDIAHARDAEWRKANGIAVAVSLCEARGGDQDIQFGIKDDAEFPVAGAVEIVNEIIAMCSRQPKVLIHCIGGVSRSVAAAIAVVALRTGKSWGAAKWAVYARHPHPRVAPEIEETFRGAVEYIRREYG